MKIIDLSHTIKHQMPAYPEDQPPVFKRTFSIAKQGYEDHVFKSSLHVGTHMDAPSHMIKGGASIDRVPLDRFWGKAVLVDVSKFCKPREEITFELGNRKFPKNSIVLVYTGHDKYFGKKQYFDTHPMVSEKFAQFCVDSQIKMLGIDFPGPDHYPFRVHKILLKHKILIIENLTNLAKLRNLKKFNVIAFPIKFQASGAFVRVAALVR